MMSICALQAVVKNCGFMETWHEKLLKTEPDVASIFIKVLPPYLYIVLQSYLGIFRS